MKPDLTYEQCRDLEKWGLGQTLEEGDWIYFGKDTTRLVESYVDAHNYMEMAPGAVFKLPSVEEMISLLKSKLHRVVIQQDFDDLWRAGGWPPMEWEESFRTRIWGKGKASLIPALYSLCEKVFGGKEGE